MQQKAITTLILVNCAIRIISMTIENDESYIDIVILHLLMINVKIKASAVALIFKEQDINRI